jgi:membrane protein DedA with SNARE-associated domain
MTVATANNNGDKAAGGWLRRHIGPLAGLLLVVAVTAGIVYVYSRYPGLIEDLQTYGYLGALVISIIFNATLILPAGNILILAALGAALPLPGLVGIAGGTGAAIGEITGYVAGRSGRSLVSNAPMYGRVERWLERWGWLAVFVFSVFPFIFDLVGIAAGALRYPFWKFLLFCWLGRMLLYILVALLASWGFGLILPWLG